MFLKTTFYSLFFGQASKPGHLPVLDGLRGMAIMMVLIAHTNSIFSEDIRYVDYVLLGDSGVYLFFILSAYLLDRQIAVAIKEKRVNGHYWMQYVWNRFLRIYPLFFLALLVFWLPGFLGANSPIPDLATVGSHLILREGRWFFWTIPVEIKYYLFSPALLILFHRVFRWNKLAIVITLIAVGSLGFFLPEIQSDRISLFAYLPIFFIGTLIAIAEVCWIRREWTGRSLSGALEVLGMLGLTLFLMLLLQLSPFPISLLHGFQEIVSLAMIFIAARYGSGFMHRFFEWRSLQVLGKISFSLYLTHLMVLRIVKHALPDSGSLLKFTLYFSGSLVVATCTYLFAERPLSKLKHLFHSEKVR